MTLYKFIRTDRGYYESTKNPIDDTLIWLLYETLQNFASTCAYSLLEKKLVEGDSNTCSYNDIIEITTEKKRVTLHWQPTEGYSFEMDRNHLLNLTKEWRELCKADAPEIIIRRIGEHFTLEGIFKP